ncbi:hypothetical protein K1T71_010345 [Dendrolimus kikuchii]|uniref:Uncharacterized protein n=1 Tax=Dendrolimus kikuchii TaxID=765133 RepID=A0ACC1CRA3_9NEOP|nr:hypothetical protein K1T71_010345 [Dendrolimus kikuchii]
MITFRRFYHTTFITCSIKKQGLKLCKMVNPKAKKQWHPSPSSEADAMPTVKSLAKIKYEPGKRGIRRLAMLNKMFMKQITDIMSTGTVSMDIVGRGIEISKVHVTPDFNTVNVFWLCKGTSSDDEVEMVLNRVAGALRHELSTLRVMGVVPYIEFVKDKQESHIVDLDRRLVIADYGNDYETTDPGHILKSEFTLHTKLSPEIMAKIRHLEEEQLVTEDPLPEMTHTVYGLDHFKILSRLLAARKKSKDAWSNLEADSTVMSYRTLDKLSKVEPSNQRQELAEFLQKRQILQQQLQKGIRDARQDWQVPRDNDAEDSDEDIYEEYYEDDNEYYSDDEVLSRNDERNVT